MLLFIISKILNYKVSDTSMPHSILFTFLEHLFLFHFPVFEHPFPVIEHPLPNLESPFQFQNSLFCGKQVCTYLYTYLILGCQHAPLYTIYCVRSSFPVLEFPFPIFQCPLLFQNILSCFRTSFSCFRTFFLVLEQSILS